MWFQHQKKGLPKPIKKRNEKLCDGEHQKPDEWRSNMWRNYQIRRALPWIWQENHAGRRYHNSSTRVIPRTNPQRSVSTVMDSIKQLQQQRKGKLRSSKQRAYRKMWRNNRSWRQREEWSNSSSSKDEVDILKTFWSRKTMKIARVKQPPPMIKGETKQQQQHQRKSRTGKTFWGRRTTNMAGVTKKMKKSWPSSMREEKSRKRTENDEKKWAKRSKMYQG